jgi:spore maturation protein CgeB
LVGNKRHDWSRSKVSIEKLDAYDDEDDFAAIPVGNIAITSDISSNQQPALNKRSGENLCCRLKSVVSSYSPEASKLIKNIEQGR